MIVFFSGTGNTRLVAQRLATEMGEGLYDLSAPDEEIFLHHNWADEQRLGILFPVYAWGPPPKFLELLHGFLCRWSRVAGVNVGQTYVFALCTCGDDIGRTMSVLARELTPYDIRLAATASVQMPETYVALPFFRLDTPERIREKEASTITKIADLSARFLQKAHFSSVVQGRFPRLKTYALRPLFNRWLINPRFFRVADSCTACARCVKVCPLQNITLNPSPAPSICSSHNPMNSLAEPAVNHGPLTIKSDALTTSSVVPATESTAPATKSEAIKTKSAAPVSPKPSFGNRCAGCLACYHHCPQHAIGYLSSSHKGQYRPDQYLRKFLP